jgi:hypothetical protein
VPTRIGADLRTAPAGSERPSSKLVEFTDIRPTRREWAFFILCLLIQEGKKEENMIISMKLHASRQEIDEVCGIVKGFGYKVHSIEGEERVVIGVVGVGDVTPCLESVEAMPQV